MNYKKINEIMLKDYYKDKNTKIGKIGSKYIVSPEDALFVLVPEDGDEIGISNENFGLIEKDDRLVYLEVEISEDNTEKFILVTDHMSNTIVGFINETLRKY